MGIRQCNRLIPMLNFQNVPERYIISNQETTELVPEKAKVIPEHLNLMEEKP